MTTAQQPASALRAGQTRNLVLATLAFAITFWAWNLIAPLGVFYASPGEMDLNASQKSILIAVPILVGSLGRIVVGVLTPRFGGRVMFTALLLLSVPFVILVAVAGELKSYPLMIVIGFFLGIAGTSFAAGIPFLNNWYEPARRGFATGVFGAGMGGTALSAFFTPRFKEWFGYFPTHIIIAGALIVVAAICWAGMRDAPTWTPNTEPPMPKLVDALKLPITWQMAFLYAAAFGGFVAFSTYLPTYLNDVYDMTDLKSAGARTAGFAVAAVIARPLGGVLSDRFGPRLITAISCGGAALLALWMITKPAMPWYAGVDFILMAVMMGMGAGSVFAWVAVASPPARVGAVTGLVGAAGGLGGFFPPLLMGATYDDADHSYTIGLTLLVVFAAAACLFTVFGIRQHDND
ncbi:MAG TPA: MFS transporter [Gordonia sp. (in: high G+C Gram-positive bacteria)]|uniref:MFS transporter n=1 Tax=unclassified Gordonia (in: high G+C Gram-positive bacteria) TaxID=2657482 RepID=UPI000FB9EF6D|nr:MULTISPECIES: MFS transporter [unclassified Gordonia (in: high G+C Gram-positive bacteria)]RUP39058.1 MAG: NarK/NasA family nitrate transporter [Gordonia sp. (in: high G+C Gram-positive bacteria)]HNP56842.1 MFS transporter [Gordonia sp. (in: high G+C Gram-positive bacteria)]HRC49828.1 MFS transporter [Gordonia sp. (in: high G+C Gram-positive bacteria)]